MATVLSTLYPPLIDTFMPAFPNVESAVVHFTVSPYNSSYEIQYLHVTLVNQKTNKNAFGTDTDLETPAGTALVNGVWIIPFAETLNGNVNPYLELNREANYYTLYIPPSLLKKNENNERKFVVDCYYKVQLRFDKYLGSNDGSSTITTWNTDYLVEKRAFFSEWSSVSLLKAIPTITLHLNNFTMELSDYLNISGSSITNLPSNLVVPTRVPQYVPGIIPFAGNLTFEGDNDSGIDKNTRTEYYRRDIRTTSNSEYIMSYQIKIFDDLENLIKDSGVLYPAKAEKTNNFYWLWDSTSAKTNVTYSVELTFTTNNQYTFSKTFNFILIEPANIDFNPTLTFNKIELPHNGLGYAWKRNDDPYFKNMTNMELSKLNSQIAEDGTTWYEVEDEKVLVTCEDGWVTLTVTHDSSIGPGYLFIKRATSLTNFKEWELIDCSYIDTLSQDFKRTITDKTVSSLVSYKYSCQYLTSQGSWTRTPPPSPEIVYPDFHDILLSRGDRQLAIRYNAQIASMTPVVSRVKIDTLGGRYPRFAENAKMHYKQFQLNGLIIAESDYNRKFLNDLDYKSDMAIYDEKMNGKYNVRNDTIKETGDITVSIESDDGTITEQTYTNGTYSQDISESDTNVKKYKRDTQKNTRHDLYPTDNWWWERKFREEAIEWLNDGEPKLYRSMPEGNLIVMIDSVSLTPNTQLGRRVWNFSATLYEVGDGNSLQQLDALGIYPIVNTYSASFTGDYSVDVDTSTSKQQLGQMPHAKAAASNGTNLITATDAARVSAILKNNKNQFFDVPTTTIGENIGNLYQGLYENYNFNINSVRLKDLKIQFESLPQWYDLASMSPQDTLLGGLYITMESKQDGETKTITGLVVQGDNGTLTVDTLANNEQPPLWFKSGMSITDFISEWENSAGNLYHEFSYETSDNKIETAVISHADSEIKYYKILNEKLIDAEYISENNLKANRYIKFNEDNTYSKIDALTNIDWLNQYYEVKGWSDEDSELIEQSKFIYLPTSFFNFENNPLYKKISSEEYYYLPNEDIYCKGISGDSEKFFQTEDSSEDEPISNMVYREIIYQDIDLIINDETQEEETISVEKQYFGAEEAFNNIFYKQIANPQIDIITAEINDCQEKINNYQEAIDALEEQLYLFVASENTQIENDLEILLSNNALNLCIENYLEEKHKIQHLKEIFEDWKSIESYMTNEGNDKDSYEQIVYNGYLNFLEENNDDNNKTFLEFREENLESLRRTIWTYFSFLDENNVSQEYKEELFARLIREIDPTDDEAFKPNESDTEINKQYELNFDKIKEVLGSPGGDPVWEGEGENRFISSWPYGDNNELYTQFKTLFDIQKKQNDLNNNLIILQNQLIEANSHNVDYYSQNDLNNIELGKYISYYNKEDNNEYSKIENIEIVLDTVAITDLYIYNNYFQSYIKISDILVIKENQTYLEINEDYYPLINYNLEDIYYEKSNKYYKMNLDVFYYMIKNYNNNSQYIEKDIWENIEKEYYLYIMTEENSEENENYIDKYIAVDELDKDKIKYIEYTLPSKLIVYKAINDDNNDSSIITYYKTFWIDEDKNYPEKVYLFLKEVFDNNKKYIYVKNLNLYFPDSVLSSSDISPNNEDSSGSSDENNSDSHSKGQLIIGPGNELIKVNTDTGESLTVEANKKHIADVVDALVWEIDNEGKRVAEKNNYGLGYKLKLSLISPYDPNVRLERTIFVNEKGYYQVPSNMSVKEITLFDEAVATLDYIIEYDLNYNDASEPNAYEVAENIVGQISGEWDWNTAIAPLVAAKYWAYDKDKNTNVITQQMIDSWKAVTFDGTPYTILNIQSLSDSASQKYIVGRSGVLNLQTDYPTSAMYVSGKRMVKAPISRQKYLDEWEYVIDESIYESQNPDQEQENISQFWYIVYANSGADLSDWISSDEVLEEGVPIIIYLSENVWDENTARRVVDKWYELGETNSIVNVKPLKPMHNTVYAIANTAGGFDYKIYYLDEGWFNIEFPNLANNDLSIANARVPVYGMIEYRASIMKKFWDPRA